MDARIQARPPTLLLVAGSGRSGTSLFTGLAHLLGFDIPQPQVRANPSNPRGFAESRWAVEFHDRLLTKARVDPQDPRPEAWSYTREVAGGRDYRRLSAWLTGQFEISDRVAVKDPRLAWFLPMYQEVVNGMGVNIAVVTMVRHPAESVDSRLRAYRGSVGSPALTAGWVNMMLATEHQTRGMSRALLMYEDLMADWRGALLHVENSTGVRVVSSASQEQRVKAATLVDPTLRRAQPDWTTLDVPNRLAEIAERSYRNLSLASATLDPTTRSSLDDLLEEYAGYYRECRDVLQLTPKLDRTSRWQATARLLYRKSRRRSSEKSASIGRVVRVAARPLTELWSPIPLRARQPCVEPHPNVRGHARDCSAGECETGDEQEVGHHD